MARISYLKPWAYDKLLRHCFSPLCVLCKQARAEEWSVCRVCWLSSLQKFTEQNKQGVHSLFSYEGFLKELLLDFKKNRHYFLHVLLARWLWQALPKDQTDVIVLAPCSQRRIKREGIDPLCLIGRDLATWGEQVCSPFYKRGLSQKVLNKVQRREHIRTSLLLRHRQDLSVLRGKRVVIIDDLLTTGATLWAIEERLKTAGVSKLSKLVLARVPYSL